MVTRIVLAISLNAIIAIISYKKNFLTGKASIAAWLVGSLFYSFGNISTWLLYLGLFLFIWAQAEIKKHLPKKQQLFFYPTWTVWQFLAYTLPGLGCLAFFFFTGNTAFYLGMIVSLATATANLWASEIGLLSKHSPFCLVGGHEVAKGISGGVSVLGTIASFVGAFLVALTSAIGIFFQTQLNFFGQSILSVYFLLVSILGVMGMFLDSLLGATIQEKYWAGKYVVEYVTKRFYKGVKGMTNTKVTFITTSLMALIGVLLSLLLFR